MAQTSLGKSDLQVPRLGVGAMTWGAPSGLARLSPAKLAYGGAHGFEEERRALEASVAAGATLFDTAAMYSGGASESRLGELARGKVHSVQLDSRANLDNWKKRLTSQEIARIRQIAEPVSSIFYTDTDW